MTQHPLAFLRKLIPQREKLFFILEHGLNAKELKFDDTDANLDPLLEEISVQQAINNINSKLTSISNLDNNSNSKIAEDIEQNTIALRLANAELVRLKERLQAIEELDPEEGGSKYWADPVLAVVDVLPPVVEGDRYLLNSAPPVIKVGSNEQFQDEELLDGAKVSDGFNTWHRQGNSLNYDVVSILRDRDPDPCDVYPVGTEWRNNNRIWKLVEKKVLTEAADYVGRVMVQSTSADNIGLNIGVEKWQSFTPAKRGLLTKIRLSGVFSGSEPIEVRIRIYEGEGTDSVPIKDEQVTTPLGGVVRTPLLFLDCPLPVEANKKYTYSITRTGGVGFVLHAWKTSGLT